MAIRQQDEERENVMQRALLFQDFMQDLRIGVRSLLRAPVLALTPRCAPGER